MRRRARECLVEQWSHASPPPDNRAGRSGKEGSTHQHEGARHCWDLPPPLPLYPENPQVHKPLVEESVLTPSNLSPPTKAAIKTQELFHGHGKATFARLCRQPSHPSYASTTPALAVHTSPANKTPQELVLPTGYTDIKVKKKKGRPPSGKS